MRTGLEPIRVERQHRCGNQAPRQEFLAYDSYGLVALKERSPAIKDLTFDIDGLAISKAKTKVEDTPVKMVIMGDAYLQREKTDKPNRFVCLISEKGKVLPTFFTEQ
jgi:hypothetical protein